MRLLRIAAVIAAWFLFVVVGLSAHHAPSGWPYPPGCCGGTDCFQLEPGDIERTQDGWLVKPTGEVFAFEDTQRSGDGHWHRCAVHPWGPTDETRRHSGNRRSCLYVPTGDF